MSETETDIKESKFTKLQKEEGELLPIPAGIGIKGFKEDLNNLKKIFQYLYYNVYVTYTDVLNYYISNLLANYLELNHNTDEFIYTTAVGCEF